MKGAASGDRVRSVSRRSGASIPATEAQNNFGRVLGRAKREGRVFITRYDRPEAVVLSIEEYGALTGRQPVDLEALEREFDATLLDMQSPEHIRAVDRLFAMTGPQLGQAALAGAADRAGRGPEGANARVPPSGPGRTGRRR